MSDTTQSAEDRTAARPGLSATLASMLSATDAFKNVRAIVLLGLTFVASALIGGAFAALGASTHSAVIGFLGVLLALAVVFYGLNAVGIMMMKDAQGTAQHAIADAVMLSLYTSHRVLVVAILEGLIVLGAVLVIALVLFVCKVPVLGPILYTFVFPLSAIILGVLVFSLFYVMLPLTGPAVWTGSTVFQVIARLSLIVRTRLVEVVLSQVVLFFLAGFVGLLIFGVVGIGVMMTAGMSAGILGAGEIGMGGMGGMMAMMQGGGSGYAIAGALGGGLLFAIAAVIPALILTKGICLIYLNTTRDLDFAASEAQLGDGLASVKRHADEARERARQLAEQHRPASPAAVAPVAPVTPVTPATPATPAAAALTCPNCQTVVAADDVFCGNCAHKLH
ncbi:MAG: zinc ribbon domain-containing protein [Herminiimonas sp.]|nr:zinc ribbon domain-containing protein [Herminiimonas sp.]